MLNIQTIKDKILPVCNRYQVKNVFLFGSYSRGEASDNSDVDLRVDLGDNMKGLAVAEFYADLEEALGCSLDVMTTRQLSASFLKHIQNDEVQLLPMNTER